MKNRIAKCLIILPLMLLLCSCGSKTPSTAYPDGSIIALSDSSAMINGSKIEEYDYTWHCDPSVSHDEVKNAPAEYYTGTKPETDAAVYIDHELYYYPLLSESDFTLVNYDGETEWAYYYADGEHNEYIFATLPSLGNTFPHEMMHSEKEAAENKVLHITKPGTYILEGSWKGQIWVDLGDKEETFTDENAKVTLILNGVDINCSVAPGIVFYSAYECDNAWEERETYSENVSTENAGAAIVISDGTENTVTGTNIYRMLKTAYKDENISGNVKLQKKMRKTDGALYSYVTMNILGEEKNSGSLTINSGFEGLNSELHLSVLGGNVIINSSDDGINVNEDNVSVVSFKGGNVTLHAALGAEGDGVDSNGFIVIDGGNLNISGIVPPDSALDSENGIYYISGSVIIDGEKQSYNAGDVFSETGRNDMHGQPGQMPQGMEPFPGDIGKNGFDIKEFKEKVAALDDDATLEDVLALLGMGQQRDESAFPDRRP